MKKILFIVGSFRKNSFNRQLAQYTKEQLEGKADVSFLEYKDLPFLNQDEEFPAPVALERVRQEVKSADALWIFTPEYNGFIPGSLKNLMDWLSRKLSPEANWKETVLANKVVTYSGAAGQSGSARAQEQLKNYLPFIQLRVMEEPCAKVQIKADDFGSDVLTLNEEDKEAIAKQIEAFIQFIDQ